MSEPEKPLADELAADLIEWIRRYESKHDIALQIIAKYEVKKRT